MCHLYWVKQQMHQKITANWCEQAEYYADAFPIAVCKFARALNAIKIFVHMRRSVIALPKKRPIMVLKVIF